MFILLFITMLFVPVIAEAQTTCSALGGGTLYCDGPRGSSSITELSPGMGIITRQDRNGSSSMDPYSIIGQNRERSSYSRQPIEPLDRLPSSSSYGSSSYGSGTTFEERQAIRESGRIPW